MKVLILSNTTISKSIENVNTKLSHIPSSYNVKTHQLENDFGENDSVLEFNKK